MVVEERGMALSSVVPHILVIALSGVIMRWYWGRRRRQAQAAMPSPAELAPLVIGVRALRSGGASMRQCHQHIRKQGYPREVAALIVKAAGLVPTAREQLLGFGLLTLFLAVMLAIAWYVPSW